MSSRRLVRVTTTEILPLDRIAVVGFLRELCARLPEGDWDCEYLTTIELTARIRWRPCPEAYAYRGKDSMLWWWAERVIQRGGYGRVYSH